jgi:WD40 repeat protein
MSDVQVHQGSVRCLNWSNDKKWLLSGDDTGTLNYLQANMNTVAQIYAHSGPVRGIR